MPSSQRDTAEPGRDEGLGKRVRRFVKDELGLALDKTERRPGTHSERGKEEDQMSSAETGQAREPNVVHDVPQTTDPAPMGAHPVLVDEADRPRHADHPTGDHPAGDHPVATRDTAQDLVQQRQAPREEPVGGSSDQKTTSAEWVGLLNDTASLREQWRSIQGTFVDDPRQAVEEASTLVDRTLNEIRRNLGGSRDSESMSTEDLRVSFKRYREFFERLLSV